MRGIVAALLCLLVWLPSGALAAKDFVFTDSNGRRLALSDYRGKWVLINFWATWCPPCLKEIPDLVSLHESRKDVVVIGVAMEYQNPRTVLEFVNSLSITYPIVLGNRKIASQIGPISMLPTTYLFDPTGQPAAYKVGLVSRESLEAFMQGNSSSSRGGLPGSRSRKP
jgi:thiol-disulfide isomerase/thioredoxin|nr:TlpA disulfide reductase family protein [Nitrosovibrio sp. Nv17]